MLKIPKIDFLVKKNKSIPILLYHGITESQISPNPYYISVKAFQDQMDLLAFKGYKTISVSALLKAWELGESLVKKIVVTFDDGYSSIYKLAAPILHKHFYTATLFLTSNPISQINFSNTHQLFRSALVDDRPLKWSECKELLLLGWELGGHSCSHPDLRKLSPTNLDYELRQNRVEIEKNLDYTPLHFAYPNGGYNQNTINQIRALGYHSGLSVHSGKAKNEKEKWNMHRICIQNKTKLKNFERLIETGYGSKSEKFRSLVRDFFYQNLSLKDGIEKIISFFIKETAEEI